eukprot:2703033-Pyramimonas_sp.AAC.4
MRWSILHRSRPLVGSVVEVPDSPVRDMHVLVYGRDAERNQECPRDREASPSSVMLMYALALTDCSAGARSGSL